MEVYEKAKSLLAAGRLDEAHTLYSQFIEEQSDSCEHAAAVTDAYNSRGHIRYLWVDFPAATEDYSRAIERDPSFAMAHYNRGQVMYRLGICGRGCFIFGAFSYTVFMCMYVYTTYKIRILVCAYLTS